MTRTAACLLRIAAWTLLALAAGRLVLHPARAGLEGRLMQMQVRGEASRAAAALFTGLGLDKHFDSTRYRLVGAGPAGRTPIWLKLEDRHEPDHTKHESYIRLEADGTFLLPPLSNPIRSRGQWQKIPSALRLPGPASRTLVGATCVLGDMRGRSEYTVWVHRPARWVNVLHFAYTALNQNKELIGRPDGVLELGQPVIERFVWNPEREQFMLPETPAPGVELLELLPAQVGGPASESRP